MTREGRNFCSELDENQIVVLDAFLSPSRICTILEKTRDARWYASQQELPPQAAGGGPLTPKGRNSSTSMAADLGAEIVNQLTRIESKLKRMLGVEPANLEPWQITRYKRGEAFDYHLDCGLWADHPSGERRRTIMIYLKQPEQGGATHFRALNLTIRPVAGRLVVWNNLLPGGRSNYAMIHAGRPVWQGRKIILTTWEHESRYADFKEILS